MATNTTPTTPKSLWLRQFEEWKDKNQVRVGDPYNKDKNTLLQPNFSQMKLDADTTNTSKADALKVKAAPYQNKGSKYKTFDSLTSGIKAQTLTGLDEIPKTITSFTQADVADIKEPALLREWTSEENQNVAGSLSGRQVDTDTLKSLTIQKNNPTAVTGGSALGIRSARTPMQKNQLATGTNRLSRDKKFKNTTLNI